MSNQPHSPDELLSRQGAAEFAHTTTVTLDKWLRRPDGPEFIKVGRRVLIKRDSFVAWLMSHGKGDVR